MGSANSRNYAINKDIIESASIKFVSEFCIVDSKAYVSYNILKIAYGQYLTKKCSILEPHHIDHAFYTMIKNTGAKVFGQREVIVGINLISWIDGC
jgi:hypothetical protein